MASKKMLPVAVRLRIYRRLLFFARKEVSLSNAIKIMYDHASDPGLFSRFSSGSREEVAIRFWMKRQAEGAKLSEAMEGFVPSEMTSLLLAGEESNDVAGAFEMCVLVEESRIKIRKVVIQALTAPLLQMIMPIGLLMGAGFGLFPQFESFIPEEAWEGPILYMRNFFDFLTSKYMIVLAVLFVALIGVISWSMTRWTLGFRRIADNVFPYSVYRRMVGAGFLASMGALLKGGLDEVDAVGKLIDVNSGWYNYKLRSILARLNKGDNLGDAMWNADSKFPDRDFCRDIRSMAQHGGFEKQLVGMAVESLQGSVAKLEASAGITKKIGLIVVAITFVSVAGTMGLLMLTLQRSIGAGVAF